MGMKKPGNVRGCPDFDAGGDHVVLNAHEGIEAEMSGDKERFQHLRKAAQFFADGFHFADEGRQDTVLGTLRVVEVVAVDFGSRLKLAVDAAIALFEARGIPGNVEVEEIGAMGLEVEAFAGGVGGEEDANGVTVRRGVKSVFDALPVHAIGFAAIDTDAAFWVAEGGKEFFELVAEIDEGVFVGGEDDDAPVVPLAAGEEVVEDPLVQVADAGIGLIPGRLGDGIHAVDEVDFGLYRVTTGKRRRRAGLGVLFFGEFLSGEGGIVIVGV